MRNWQRLAVNTIRQLAGTHLAVEHAGCPGGLRVATATREDAPECARDVRQFSIKNREI